MNQKLQIDKEIGWLNN